jgi:hypothetical protein
MQIIPHLKILLQTLQNRILFPSLYDKELGEILTGLDFDLPMMSLYLETLSKSQRKNSIPFVQNDLQIDLKVILKKQKLYNFP